MNDGPENDPDATPAPGSAVPEQTQPIGGQRPAAERWAPPGQGPVTPASVPAASAPPPGPPPTSPPSGYPPPPPTQVLAPAHAPSGHRLERARPPGWMWPFVALLALVVGAGSGILGAIAYSSWDDDSDEPGASSPSNVDYSDLTTQPPLQKPGSVARVAQEVLPSTVQIIAELDGVEAGATGSGFVLDDQGHIITNNHVVADAAENDGPIEIVDQDGNRQNATVVGRSPVYDLAVLHVAGAEDLKPASLGRSRTLRVGEPVVAIGAPLGLSSTVTSGIVSALNRPVTTGSTADDSSYINAVQTDAAINPGNSGGPLVNLQGQVVGVNSAIATNGGGSIDDEAGNIGVGFAIPVEQVVITADQILENGEAQYPVIGARVQTGGPAEFDGATVDEVIPDSPAQDAGLQNGDLITHVNGDRVTDGIALIVAIRTHQPGETIEFTIRRDGDEQTIQVTLDGEVG
ncbi:trypsin-like peptidase domain-containing protein [Nocardioides sp. HM23]|uniref:S1C family serine protease n=1 Tax=Nocardioides bizhenqiangii TaxID=3095076 RepID=UPI002ACA3EC9|nr:trypsin-like peptidase domain-containing protein [Nocardioides sp. HM23]MDZ5623634.1 trypsin-like peptidase domain-containing protein [Nocardioides sp. HM23]